MKGIIYCRVSSHDQVQGTSLENQQLACERYAEDNGIEVERVFIEKGESATVANRTEFVKALDYCNKKKNIGAFIIWKLDRFSRKAEDHYALGAQLKKSGTKLYSVTEKIEEGAYGDLMQGLLAILSQFENEIRKQRCVSGMQGSLRKGLYIWDSKLGYKRPEKEVRRVTEPDVLDEPRASLIRRGMMLYAEGNTSVSELSRLSRKWGLRTRTGISFYKQRWSQILDDKYYAGILTDPWTGEEYQGLHEALISLGTFERIQSVKKKSGKSGIPHLLKNPEFPLRRLVKCYYCDNYLTGSSSKGRAGYHSYYHCKNKKCEEYGRTIRKADLEGNFIDFLSTLTPKEECLKLFEATILNVWKEKRNNATDERNLYSEQVRAIETRMARIREMRADGEIDKEEYQRMKADTETKLTAFKISENEADIEKLDLEARIAYSTQYISDMARIWQDLDIDQKIKLQKAVLPEGITFDKRSGEFGTAPLSYVFRLFWQFPMETSGLVAGPGIEPTYYHGWPTM